MLSFGYWTTNFAEVQRALSAKNLSAAERTPLIGAFPKIFIPLPDHCSRTHRRRARSEYRYDGDLPYNMAILFS